uniref:hypothetical protein n=1 Tax=Endozoicomonas sp. ONNA2 TaxID=2828741 RepID=UPI0021487AF9
MLPATTNTDRSCHPAQSVPDSYSLVDIAQAFQRKVMALPEEKRSEPVQSMLSFINYEFPNEIPQFQRAVNQRTGTLVENFSGTRAVLVHPMDKLMVDYQYDDLPSDLNDLVNAFNSELTNFNIISNSDEAEFFKERGLSPIARKLRDFGKVILGNHKGSIFGNKECRQAEKERSVKWYKSIKTLCDGVLAPLLDKSASPGLITKSKEDVIKLLEEQEQPRQLKRFMEK